MGKPCRLVSGRVCPLGLSVQDRPAFPPAPALHLSIPGTPLEHKN